MKQSKTTWEMKSNLAIKVEKAVSQKEFINQFIPLNGNTSSEYLKTLKILRSREN
ncbi:MAG: hypothetical protein MRY83_06365 [Flavobacteriales bacterium]|nr:hypothetical protein [Flavobacteriales bacterium]